jgi:hypothetical protein
MLLREPAPANSGELGVLLLQDGSRQVLATNRNLTLPIVTWSPDGRLLLYGQSGMPRVLNTAAPIKEGGAAAAQESWPLADPGQVGDWMIGTGSWAPDGSFIVLSQSDAGEELRQWHGLTAAAIAQMSRPRRHP